MARQKKQSPVADKPPVAKARNPNADDEGNCINCDGTGHDPWNDGELCRRCNGAGNFNDDDEG